MNNTDLKNKLFELKDEKYKAFHTKLLPTVDVQKIIGIRVPILRKFAAEFYNEPYAKEFLNTLPHYYYEENNIHAFLIEKSKNFDEAIRLTDRFLPYIDNWATCDMLRPKIFSKNKEKLLPYIEKWLNSEHSYTVRYGIEMLMVHFLDENFSPKHTKQVSEIRSNEYYVNMMIAWYFATALAKQYDLILPYFQTITLDKWTHNKAIQKAIESYRITDEQKAELRKLKIK